jgi:predicted DNA binding protein
MTMRKLTLEIEPNEMARNERKAELLDVQSYEILEQLKIDYEEGICVDLIEYTLREGVSIENIKSVGHMEIMSVIKSEGNKHTCLIKYYEPEESKEEFKESELDLIYSTPTIISEDRFVLSVIGENENLKKFIELMKINAGKIVNMSFKKAVYQRQDMLSILTDKQKEVLMTAHKYGYYDYPKKINSEGLAKKVSIGRATLVQHLRKAEGRIVAEIMDGYSS